MNNQNQLSSEEDKSLLIEFFALLLEWDQEDNDLRKHFDIQDKILRELRQHMANLDSAADYFIIDGHKYEYDTYIDGEYGRAWYIASWNSTATGSPVLQCSYGLSKNNKVFTYSSASPLSNKKNN